MCIRDRNVAIGLDGRKHRRTLNILGCGGSGAGKTRFLAKPNIMNANTSYVCLDPKGELLRDTGNLLKAKGYKIKVIDLINMEKSHCYNPFAYLRNDNDIQRLVTNLFKNTTPKGAQSQDPFWDQAAQMLLLALVFYLHYEAPEEEQNFPMVMEMIRAGEVREDDDTYQSPLDELFDRLEMRDPEHIALKYYRNYHSGSGKTLKSIQITLISRLEKFNLESLAGITQTDEMELWKLGEEKTAIFSVIPDNDSSFNFVVGMLYTQLFQQLYYQADVVHGGRLPVHVHFVMDEFANVALPDEFDKLLATMRSREISVTIIIQNMAQLKALFEKQWESIVGNCDEFLYLGGNEQSTHEYVSKLLGKETIDTNTYGQSKGCLLYTSKDPAGHIHGEWHRENRCCLRRLYPAWARASGLCLPEKPDHRLGAQRIWHRTVRHPPYDYGTDGHRRRSTAGPLLGYVHRRRPDWELGPAQRELGLPL